MTAIRKLLVTGLGGAVGSAIRPALEEHFEVAALSRSGVTGIPPERDFRGDIAELESIRHAFDDIDAVVHLAAEGGVNSAGGMNSDWDPILKSNVIGARNVFEAAKTAGVKRIVFASSGATVLGWEDEEPYASLVSGDESRIPLTWRHITHQDVPKPRSYYGVSKLMGEDLARMYSAGGGPSIICLRIGSCSPANMPSGARGASIYVSHRDIAQLVIKCLDAPDSVRFDIFFGVSDNRLNYRDWAHARDVVGYVPQDRAEDTA